MFIENKGFCDLCDQQTVFRSIDQNFRNNYKCSCSRPVGPRQRALMHVLKLVRPNFKSLHIHESSPAHWSRYISDGADYYVGSHFFPNQPLGKVFNGYRCEDLERQTFEDSSFDIVVTQDVMEHVLDPAQAFAEIARTLKPGGIHIFTTPILVEKTTYRARRGPNGMIEYLAPPSYHGNPISNEGSLVTVHWGNTESQ